MKTLLPVIAFSLLPLACFANTGGPDPEQEKVAVVAVVQRFFDALHTRDSEGLRATCQPGAQITAGRPTDGGYALRQRPIETDIVQLAEAKEVWLERMWSPTSTAASRWSGRVTTSIGMGNYPTTGRTASPCSRPTPAGK